MTYPNLSDEEILKLREAISNTFSNMKKDIRKDKLKVLGKALLAFVIVAGGVTVSIIFPNTITIGVLGGAATLLAGSNGALGKPKRLRRNQKKERKIRKK